ncbi:hypothetical protein TNCV_4019271 [Trichonephila clavipes]|nr:hypothetical protein TNCV_4019271 [Trichonephila clavipes]
MVDNDEPGAVTAYLTINLSSCSAVALASRHRIIQTADTVVDTTLSKILEDLRNNIRDKIDDIPVDMLEKGTQSFRNRLHQCIDNEQCV